MVTISFCNDAFGVGVGVALANSSSLLQGACLHKKLIFTDIMQAKCESVCRPKFHRSFICCFWFANLIRFEYTLEYKYASLFIAHGYKKHKNNLKYSITVGMSHRNVLSHSKTEMYTHTYKARSSLDKKNSDPL